MTAEKLSIEAVTDAVVQTGVLLGNATDGYYLNMPQNNKSSTLWPTIDLKTLVEGGVTLLKVYDDGDKEGNYSNQCNGLIILQAPEGYKLKFSGTLWTENGSKKGSIIFSMWYA